MSMSQSRIPQVDGLRGFAILLVVGLHYIGSPELGDDFALQMLEKAVSMGQTGVDLFFVLSGFLLGGILMANRRSENYFKTFYLRRFYRILPLYFVSLALFFSMRSLLAPVLMPEPYDWLFQDQTPLWSYLTLTQNFPMAVYGFGSHWLGMTWSLAVEEQFYLVLPLLIYVCPPRRLPLVLIGLAALAPVLRFISLAVLQLPRGDYVLLPCRLDALMRGVLCAYALQRPGARTWLMQHHRLLYGLLGVFALGFLVFTWTGLQAPLTSALGYLWIAAGYSCLLLSVVTGSGVLSRFFANRPLRELGIIAYGVYLFHQAVNGLLHGLILGRFPIIGDLPGIAITLLALIFTLLLAHLSWRFFEQRFVLLGQKHKYQPVSETPAVQTVR